VSDKEFTLQQMIETAGIAYDLGMRDMLNRVVREHQDSLLAGDNGGVALTGFSARLNALGKALDKEAER
jgi:hypothetical protein